MVSLAFFVQAQSGRGRAKTPHSRRAGRKPARPPVTSFVNDSGGRELIVRVLDIGQGDATYIRNGSSRVIIDGGPDTAEFGRYLDSLNLNNSTIDVVILCRGDIFIPQSLASRGTACCGPRSVHGLSGIGILSGIFTRWFENLFRLDR